MAEVFKNSLSRALGSVSSNTSAYIGITTNLISGVDTASVSVGDLVDSGNYIAGTKVVGAAGTEVTVDRDSTNTAVTSNQTVRFLAPTTAYTSPAATKSILIGGTFANNTASQLQLTVEVYDTSAGISAAIASKIPVPAGSSFVITDAGKTLLEANDIIRVYCDTDNGIDVTLSLLQGVS